MENQIVLQGVQIMELVLKTSAFDKTLSTKAKTVDLAFDAHTAADNPKCFYILFNLDTKKEHVAFQLNIKAIAYFEASQIVDEAFMQSSFVKISAPAIAFPYIRAFISNLTLNAGYDPIILPSFNFIKIAAQTEQQSI